MKKPPRPVLLCTVLLLLPLAAGAAVWTGAAANGNWNDGANWSGGAVPGGGDSVEIPASAAPYPNFSRGAPKPVASLEIKNGARLDFAPGVTLTVGGPVRANGTLNLASGILAVSGNLTGAGTITSNGGGITAGGIVDQTGGISGGITISAGRDITLHRTPAFTAGDTALIESRGGTISFTQNLNIPAGVTLTLNCPAARTVLIMGNVELYGTLNAGSPPASAITMRVGGNWKQTQSGYADPAHTGTFNHRGGTVAFSNSVVEIDGVNTTWHNLEFTNNGGTTVRFRNYPDSRYSGALGHHIGGVFGMTNGAGSLLTSLTSTGAADAGGLPPAPPASASDYNLLGAAHADKFWNLYYDPGKTGVFDALEYATLDWCWVRPTIHKAMTVPLTGNWTVPYVPNSRYNVGWNAAYLVYSFTEDWDHNGRIDHIRVQSSAPAGLDFTGLSAETDGYTVKRVFRYTASLSSPPGVDDYLFFIELEEKDYPDTDQTPSWNITGYGNFTSAAGAPFTLLDSARVPIDTAPPQVAYSLALPGGNEIFIRMSEPVEFAAGFSAAASIRVNGAAGAYSLVPVTTVSGRLLEFTITGVDPSSLTAAAIARELNFEFAASVRGHFHDSSPPFSYPPAIGAQTAGSYLLWPKGREYGYGAVPDAYEDRAPIWTGGDPAVTLTGMQNYNWKNVSGSPVYEYVHRVSDILVARDPASAAAPFFAQPVYAHDLNGEGGANSRSRVFNFDGTGELLYSDLTIQAKLNDDVARAPGAGGLELYYAQDARIPAGFRSSGHGIEGLWLPLPRPPLRGISGLVPRYYQADRVTGLPQGGNRYNFHIPRSTLRGAGTLEFYFGIRGLGSDLVVARLDTAAGSPGPWYRRIKPFALRVVDLPRQRGGVTIFSNVINPGRGDHVIVSCVLGSGGRMTAQVFSMDGTLIKTLENGVRGAGEVVIRWDGKNEGGRAVARGLYVIRVVAPDIDEVRKVLVVR
jgi:hypothetical protein